MRILQKIAEYIIHEVSKSGKVLFIASPGFGKSRSIPHICRLALCTLGVEKILVLTRSHAEISQLVSFFKEETPDLVNDVGFLLGRERVCPFRARTSLDCSLFRSDGTCQLWRVSTRDVKQVLCLDLDPEDLARRLSVCPYDIMLAKSKQSKIIIASYLYLSNMELTRVLYKVLSTENFLLIVDEAHGLLTGLESTHRFPIAALSKSTSMSGLSKLMLELDVGEEIIFEPQHLDLDKVKSGVEQGRELVRVIDMFLNISCSDLISIRRLEEEIEVRSYTLRSVLRLVDSCRGAVFLTASVSPDIAKFSPVARGFKIVHVRDDYSRFRNLAIYVVHDVEFTFRKRVSKTARRVILEVVNTVLSKLPLVGGVALVFSSREFLNIHLDYITDILSREVVYVVQDRVECERVLESFKASARRERAILITYAGSPLMEGVNYLQDELICVVLLGFPYPEFNTWNEAKKRLLSSLTKHSFLVTYLLPAVSTSIQCIGRVTRDLDKRVKFAVLVDSRFRRFLKYFPEWVRKRSLLTSVSEFRKTFGEVFPLS